MKLTISLSNNLLSLFFPAPSFEYAVNRVKQLCVTYNTNLYLLDRDFDKDSINEIDDLYCQILSS